MALTDLIREAAAKFKRSQPPPQENQTGTEEKDLVKEVEDLYKRSVPCLLPLHRRFFEELLWYYGEHYMEFDARWGRFVIRPARQYVPRGTANYILDIAERLIGFSVKNMPVGNVVPEDESCEAQKQAENANRIRKQMAEDDELELKARVFAANLVILGNGIFLTSLEGNSQTIDFELPDPETGEPIQVSVPWTDVSTQVVSPMEIIPDIHAKSPSELRSYIHCPAVTIDSLVDEFGSKAKEVQADLKVDSTNYYHMKILDMVTRSGAPGVAGGFGLYSANQEEAAGKTAIKKCYYKLPDRKNPQGVLRIVAGGVLLHDGPYPYVGDNPSNAKINLQWSRWSILPGVPWGFGAVRPLIDPQKRYNGMVTQAALNRKISGNNQWMSARGLGFSPEGTGAPSKCFYYSAQSGRLAGHKPERLEARGMSQDFWRELDNNEHQLDRISGTNDVLRGENPQGVTAGVSLELLAEQASSRFDPQIGELRRTVINRDEFRLSMVHLSSAWKLGKQMLIQDENGRPESVTLSSLDVTENPRIALEAAPPVLFTHAAKKARTEQAMAAGLIDLSVPSNREQLRNDLGVSSYKDPVSADVKLAQNENYSLMQGKPVAVRRVEDSREHLKIHRELLLLPEYEELPLETRKVIEDHYTATVLSVQRLAVDLQPKPDPVEPPAPTAPGQPKPGPGTRPAPGAKAPPMSDDTEGLPVA